MRKEFKTILVGSSYDKEIDESIATHSKNNIDVFSIRIDSDPLYGREIVYLKSLLTEKTYKAIKSNEGVINDSYVILDEVISLPEDVSDSIRISNNKSSILRLANLGLVEIQLSKRKTKHK